MLKHTLTRRSFAVGAGLAVAGAGLAGGTLSHMQGMAFAEDDSDAEEAAAEVHTLCNGCSRLCGLTAYVSGGAVGKVIGDESNPTSCGKLCARGYAYPQIATSEERLTTPLKRDAQGSYQAISWDDAIAEIGAKVLEIQGNSGGSALAAIMSPRPSGSYYLTRYLHALGSANVYTNAAARDLSARIGSAAATGYSSWESDITNAKALCIIGDDFVDAMTPAQLQQLQAAHETGCHITVVSGKLSGTEKFVDEWIGAEPGTELAFVLGLSNVLVENDLYDSDFIAKHAKGFAGYGTAIQGYTASWAEDVCGVTAGTVVHCARTLAKAAPHASIMLATESAAGCCWENSAELARSAALANGLLGAYGKQGGAVLLDEPTFSTPDGEQFAEPPAPEHDIVGLSSYPLAHDGSALAALEATKSGEIKAMFFYNANPMGGYSNPQHIEETIDALELSVAIDVQMSETCAVADYVLPECSYLERSELPQLIAGLNPSVALRTQIIEPASDSKPIDEIVTLLAQKSNVGNWFNFTLDELAQAQLATVGLDLNAVRMAGTVRLPNAGSAYKTPKFKTDSGKLEFSSKEFAAAGLSATPTWTAPSALGPDELHLVSFNQPIHTHSMTTNNAALMALTEKYDLTCALINSDTASAMGIASGDEIEVASGEASLRTRVKATQTVHPKALFMPNAYGVSVKEQTRACNVGVRPAELELFELAPATGAAMHNKACVVVKKVS